MVKPETKNNIAIGVITTVMVVTVALVLFYNRNLSNPNEVQNSAPREISEAPIANKEESEQEKALFAIKNGKSVYKVKKDDKWVVVYDNQESATYDFVNNPTFSTDGSQFAYSAVLNNQTYLVINNVQKITPYEQITSVVFSPDGNRLAYVADKGQKFVIVLDDKESKEYEQISKLSTKTGEAYVVFSSDSQKIAYAVVADEGVYVVVNGQAGKVYDSVSDFQFSDDSKQFAYQADNGSREVTIVNNSQVIVDSSNSGSPTSNSGATNSNNSNPSTSSGQNNSNSSSPSHRPASTYDPNVDITLPACGGTSGVFDCPKW